MWHVSSIVSSLPISCGFWDMTLCVISVRITNVFNMCMCHACVGLICKECVSFFLCTLFYLTLSIFWVRLPRLSTSVCVWVCARLIFFFRFLLFKGKMMPSIWIGLYIRRGIYETYVIQVVCFCLCKKIIHRELLIINMGTCVCV